MFPDFFLALDEGRKANELTKKRIFVNSWTPIIGTIFFRNLGAKIRGLYTLSFFISVVLFFVCLFSVGFIFLLFRNNHCEDVTVEFVCCLTKKIGRIL